MMEFVSAEQRDLPLLFQLNRQLIDTYEDISAIDYEKVLFWVRKNLEDSLPHFRKILYQEKPAGFFCLKDGELDSLFVFPEFQGLGIGTEVIRFCQRHSSTLRLFVFKENSSALALYKRMGFQILQKAGTTRYIMEWKNQDL